MVTPSIANRRLPLIPDPGRYSFAPTDVSECQMRFADGTLDVLAEHLWWLVRPLRHQFSVGQFGFASLRKSYPSWADYITTMFQY